MKLLMFAVAFATIAVFEPIFARSVEVIDKSENDLVYRITEALQNLHSRVSKLEHPGNTQDWREIDEDPSSTVQFLPGSNGIRVVVPVHEHHSFHLNYVSFQFKTVIGKGVLFHGNQWSISNVSIHSGLLHFYDGVSTHVSEKYVADDEWHTVVIIMDESERVIQTIIDDISTTFGKVRSPLAGSMPALTLGGDLFNSSNTFIGCMRNVKLGRIPIQLNKYYNAVPGCSIKPATASVMNLKTGDFITFEFLNNYVPQTTFVSYVERSESADRITIEFVTNKRNQILLGLKGEDAEHFNVMLDNRGFLKLEFFMFSRFYEFVIGNESLADGNPHSVSFILIHYGPSIFCRVDDNYNDQLQKISAPSQLNESSEFRWSTLSLGRNGTGFAGCITRLSYHEEDLLTFLWNTSVSSNYFKSARTVPKHVKSAACSNYKYDFGTGLGDTDISNFLKRREDHKHHTHDSCHRGIGGLTGTNYSRQFLEALQKDLQNYLQRQDKVGARVAEPVKPEPKKSDDDNEIHFDAYCDVRPNTAIHLNNRLNIRGRVAIKYQPPREIGFYRGIRRGQYSTEKITLQVQIRGLFPPQSKLGANYTVGMHIHEFGNLTNGCNSAGGHFNPFKKSHGSPHSSESHFGDFGNIVANAEGVVNTTFVIERHRNDLVDVAYIGKALVIHEKEDDLGLNVSSKESKVNGNAGPRVACCIIYPIKGHHDTHHDHRYRHHDRSRNHDAQHH